MPGTLELNPVSNSAVIGPWPFQPLIEREATWEFVPADSPAKGEKRRLTLAQYPDQFGIGQYTVVLDASDPPPHTDGNELATEIIECTALDAQLKRDLEAATRFAEQNGDTLPTTAAIEACMRLAGWLLPLLVGHSDIKMAGFDGEEGNVSLVFQSSATKRRLTIDFSADGTQLVEWKTDEALRVVQTPHSADHVTWVGETAYWLTAEH